MEQFYTINEIAKILSLHPEHIRKIIRSGELTAYKVGGVWRIKMADVEAYLKPNNPKISHGG